MTENAISAAPVDRLVGPLRCPFCDEQPRAIEDDLGFTIGHICRSQVMGFTLMANHPTENAAIICWNEKVESVRREWQL
jgi:hypothetical protein